MQWYHSFKFDDEEINGCVPYFAHEYIYDLLKDIDFKDKTVLDVGCWDGNYCIYASKRGAKSVLGIDVDPWSNTEWKTKFDYVVKKSGVTNVSRQNLSVYDVKKKYDIVLFMGVLYHLKHPLLALEVLRDVTKERIVVETHVAGNDIPYPCMKFYPDKELNNDPTNFWSPNIQCTKDMMSVAGFKNIKMLSKENVEMDRIVVSGE